MVIAVRKHCERESFSESDHSAYQETSAITNDFNYPSEDNINFISTDSSAQIQWWAHRVMVKTVVDRVMDLDLG